ncbi:MAG: hypothetical protein AAGD14_02845 [Planctomycetota bacterium]
MPTDVNWTRVLAIETHPAASLVHSLLTEAGFHPAPVAEAEAVYLAGADLQYYVEVPAAEAVAARTLLHDRGYAKHVLPPGS